MSRNRAVGTAAETAVAGYLQAHGFPHAERRALHGAHDKGDLTGTLGLCWEIKAHARLAIPEWLRETETERGNARAAHGLLVIKPKGVGVGNVNRWWTVMHLQDAVTLLREAGYGEGL